eukprot:7954444-Lingulodinium_polyedra.AAC.1
MAAAQMRAPPVSLAPGAGSTPRCIPHWMPLLCARPDLGGAGRRDTFATRCCSSPCMLAHTQA